MSARQQAGQLRAIFVKNLKKSRVKAAMAQTLINNGQVASGTLVRAVLAISESKSFRITYKINREFDVIYDAYILGYDGGRLTLNNLIKLPYAQSVDTVLGRERSGMAPSVQAIEQWISKKLSNGTWKGGNMYIVNRGGKSYSYSLTNLKYRRKLAFVIARSIKRRGYLETRSPYLTEGGLRLELAVLETKNEFELIWGNQLAQILGNKIAALF